MSGKKGWKQERKVQAQKKNQGERRREDNRRNRTPSFFDASAKHAQPAVLHLDSSPLFSFSRLVYPLRYCGYFSVFF